MDISADSIDGAAIAQSTVGHATVMTPKGSLTYETCDGLLAALEQAGNETRPMVVIDCRQVAAMDSVALEVLKSWHETFRDSDGWLKLANLNDVCTDIMMVTRLSHTLDIRDSVEQAVKPE